MIAVVIAGEKIAELVKGEFLRIAQPNGDDLQFRSIGMTTKHRAGIGQRLQGEAGPVIDDPVPEIRGGAAVGDGEINFAVGTHF